DGGGAARLLGRPVRRRPVEDEVGHVVAGPGLLLGVPPDVAFALRPRPAFGIGGGAVVHEAPVGRPGPAPFGSHPALLAGPAAARPLGLVLGVDPRLQPPAAGRPAGA